MFAPRFCTFVSLITFFISLATTTAQVPDTLAQSVFDPSATRMVSAWEGFSVAMEGNYVVTGVRFGSGGDSFAGVAKVYDATTGNLLHVLGPVNSGAVGYSVAISGTRVVVGAPLDDTGNEDTGRVFVFDLAGATPTVPVAIIPNPALGVGDLFGTAVDISGTKIAVVAPRHRVNGVASGSAYVFDLDSLTPEVPIATLDNPVSQHNAQDSLSVALSGNRVALGVPNANAGIEGAGSIFVFDLVGANPGLPVATLNNPVPGPYDNFGQAVAMDGSLLVVGAPRDDTWGTDAGGAYVYDLAGGNPTVHTAELRGVGGSGRMVAIGGGRAVIGGGSGGTVAYNLNPPDPQQIAIAYIQLPQAVPGSDASNGLAIDETRILIGAYFDDILAEDAGAAYLYNATGGTSTLVGSFKSPCLAAQNHFGSSVAVTGSFVLAGAPDDDTRAVDAGRAYLYDRSGGTPDVPATVFENPEALPANHKFGTAVAASGSRAVVSSPGVGAYVYDLTSPTRETPAATLRSPNPVLNSTFGNAIAISGSRVAVTNSTIQKVYVFDVAGGTPDVPTHTLSGPEASVSYGCSVGIEGSIVVVGARTDTANGVPQAGSVYVYDLSSQNPTQPIGLLAKPTPIIGDSFGSSVAISGSRVVVGAPGDDEGASAAGAAYAFDLTQPSSFVPVAALFNPNPESVDNFGNAVAINGTHILVAAPRDNTGAADAGIAYVYDLSSPAPLQPVRTLPNPSPFANDRFGQALALGAGVAVVGTPNEDKGAFDRGGVYVFTVGAPATQAPTLTAPAAGALVNSSLRVTFTLPEPALPDSVKLTFSNQNVERVLVLSFSLETSVTHSFTFDPATPTASSEIESGISIPDGSYAVTLTYQDADGNAAAMDSSENITIDTTAPILILPSPIVKEATEPTGADVSFSVGAADTRDQNPALMVSPASGSRFAIGTTTVTVIATDSAGNQTPGSFTVKVQDTTSPVITVHPSDQIIRVGANGVAPTPDLSSAIEATDVVGVASIIQDPVTGTGLSVGLHTITLQVADAAGNFATDTVIVRVVGEPVVATLAVAGENAPGGADGERFRTFGFPAVAGDGAVAFIGTSTTGKTTQTAVYAGVEPALITKRGEDAPGTSGLTFRSFTDPVAAIGHIAFLGKAGTTKGIWAKSGSPLRKVALAGETAPGTEASFADFVSAAATQSGVFFTAKLRGATPATDFGLWHTTEAATQLLLRDGQSVEGKVVKSFQTMVPSKGLSGHGRHGDDAMPVKLIFVDGSTALARVSSTASISVQARSGAAGDLGTLSGFGLPDLTPSGELVARVTRTRGSVPAGTESAVVRFGEEGPLVLATRGGETPGPAGSSYNVLSDPIGFGSASSEDSVFFPATLRLQPPGITAASDLLLARSDVEAEVITSASFLREGEPAVGTALVEGGPLAKWSALQKVSAHRTTGPTFTAKLTGPGVTKANDIGLWATESLGDLRLVAREGATVEVMTSTGLKTKTIKTFSILDSTRGAYWARRSVSDGETCFLVYRATFTDSSQAIIRVEVP